MTNFGKNGEKRGEAFIINIKKFFAQGTVLPLISIACKQRLNSEIKKYCMTVEDNNVDKKSKKKIFNF